VGRSLIFYLFIYFFSTFIFALCLGPGDLRKQIDDDDPTWLTNVLMIFFFGFHIANVCPLPADKK
jgi:hypothetical protein